MPFAPLHHTIVAIDVESSGTRNDSLLLQMRADLRRIIQHSLNRQSIAMTDVTVSDLGDGYRVLLPATVTPMAALDPLVPNLATELRLHRATSSVANRLRLRVAVHTGLLQPEPDGTWTGTPLRESTRLLDADAARRVLRETLEANLVLVVSQTLYDTVIRHGYALDPASFRRFRLRAKETDEAAWLYVPGIALPPSELSAPAAEARSASHASPSTQIGMFGDGNVGTFHFGGIRRYGRPGDE